LSFKPRIVEMDRGADRRHQATGEYSKKFRKPPEFSKSRPDYKLKSFASNLGKFLDTEAADHKEVLERKVPNYDQLLMKIGEKIMTCASGLGSSSWTAMQTAATARRRRRRRRPRTRAGKSRALPHTRVLRHCDADHGGAGVLRRVFLSSGLPKVWVSSEPVFEFLLQAAQVCLCLILLLAYKCRVCRPCNASGGARWRCRSLPDLADRGGRCASSGSLRALGLGTESGLVPTMGYGAAGTAPPPARLLLASASCRWIGTRSCFGEVPVGVGAGLAAPVPCVAVAMPGPICLC